MKKFRYFKEAVSGYCIVVIFIGAILKFGEVWSEIKLLNFAISVTV